MSTVNDSTNPVTTDLYQFVYMSRITSNGLSGASTLNDIAEVAIENNHIDNITGILCYGNGYFLQCVEGSEQALANLKNRLLSDDRHTDLKILDFSALATRRFASWSMRSITLEHWMSTDPALKALTPFKPNKWRSDEWQQFLGVLHNYYEDQESVDKVDRQPIKYDTLGFTFSKVVGEHQAFFLIQTVLGLSIIVTLLWVMLSDKL